jgi:hypothetical protein
VIIHQWVFQEIQDTKEDQLVAKCQFIKKRELSKKQDQYQILNSLTISQESEESESEAVTTSSEHSDSKKETSTGLLNPPPEKLEFLTSSIMHQTTNLLELKHSLRTVLFKSMPLLSPNGI